MQIGIGLMKLNGALNKEDKFDWVKGSALNCPLPAQVSAFLNTIVLPYFFKLLDQEDNKEVIERVLENLRDFCDEFGPAVFQNCMDKLVGYIVTFLKKKAFCQTNQLEDDADVDVAEDGEKENDFEDSEDSEEEEEDDGIDHDEIILGNITDLINWLAKTLGNEFMPHF